MSPVNENENKSKILVSAENREEAEEIFTGLTVGRAIETPLGDSPWVHVLGYLETNSVSSGQ
jgi:PhnB protein